MGRWKREGKHSPQKNNNLIQDSEGNTQFWTTKTKINEAKETNNAHKNTLQEEILQVITENFMEILLDMVNQNVQEALKKFQDTKNKYKQTQNKKMNS
jgi:predicted house-cleaning noncanonical NTP pyrophosphatase (MazG superfamily)